MNSRKVRCSCFLVCLSVLLGFSWSAQGADLPLQKGTPLQPLPSQKLPPGSKPAVRPPATTAVVKNPSGITATVGTGGDVILKWTAVPGAISYCLQGPGTPVDPKTGMPLFVTGTTYTVKGMPPGTYTWKLMSVYNGPSGPVYDISTANPPAITSATVTRLSGRYRVTINGLRVNTPTWDTALQTDGKGDEIFVVVDLQEMNATGNLAGAAQTRDTFVYGDMNGFPSRKKAGTLSPMGGLRSGDKILNVPEPWKRSGPPLQKEFPLFVWEGNLVDGQNAVLISPAVWEQDSRDTIVPVFNSVTTLWGLTFKPMWDSLSTGFVDPKALHRVVFGENIAQGFTTASDAVGGITSHGTTLLKELTPALDLNPFNTIFKWLGAAVGPVVGESKDRPIGMTVYGGGYIFDPQIISLNYRTAEASLAPNALQRGPGILELHFVDAPNLAGNYTMYVQIERVQ